jgi:hypothetical protein
MSRTPVSESVRLRVKRRSDSPRIAQRVWSECVRSRSAMFSRSERRSIHKLEPLDSFGLEFCLVCVGRIALDVVVSVFDIARLKPHNGSTGAGFVSVSFGFRT